MANFNLKGLDTECERKKDINFFVFDRFQALKLTKRRISTMKALLSSFKKERVTWKRKTIKGSVIKTENQS